MQRDRFWEIFLTVSATVACAAIGFLYLRLQDPSMQTVAQTATVSNADPFEHEIIDTASSTPYLYRESLPARFDDWSWDATANWRSTEEHHQGSRSIRADFEKEWAGIRSSGPAISISPYASIDLSVYPASNVGDLYVELYDIYGRSLGQQSIGWYVPGGTLQPAVWQEVSIPLKNIIGTAYVDKISGFSISTKKPGTAFIDDVYLSKELIPHAVWTEPTDGPVDLFKDAIPALLPYTLSFAPEDIQQWKNLFGRFEVQEADVKIGALPEKTNGSMAMFTGGKEWNNYRVDAIVYWGPTETFSLLMRFQDDGNFVSCAFSGYGATAQIYQVKKGVSTLIGQSPGLPIPDADAWNNVKHGGSVSGDKVRCYLYGEEVLSATLPDMPTEGTVGVETWTRGSYDYPHLLRSLTVNPL